jgi:hypothetical protein
MHLDKNCILVVGIEFKEYVCCVVWPYRATVTNGMVHRYHKGIVSLVSADTI